jgi:hypothetical protein
MTDNDEQHTACEATVYQIRLKGHLRPQWTEWFSGLAIQLEDDGTTLLTGPLADQAALHGLFKRIRDVGMPLLSVNYDHDDTEGEIS